MERRILIVEQVEEADDYAFRIRDRFGCRYEEQAARASDFYYDREEKYAFVNVRGAVPALAALLVPLAQDLAVGLEIQGPGITGVVDVDGSYKLSPYHRQRSLEKLKLRKRLKRAAEREEPFALLSVGGGCYIVQAGGVNVTREVAAALNLPTSNKGNLKLEVKDTIWLFTKLAQNIDRSVSFYTTEGLWRVG